MGILKDDDDPYRTIGRQIADMPDGNTAALNQKEREDHQRDIEYDRAALWATKDAQERLGMVDSDTIDAALLELTPQELGELAEDLGNGPMMDYAHAGLVLRECLERFLFNESMREQGYEEE